MNFLGHLFSEGMASIKEKELDLIKYLEEFRRRPSKVSAELFYYTLTTPAWKKIQKVLFEWFDIYSELGSSELTTYDELKHLVTSIRQEDDQRLVDICRVFFKLRSHDRELLQTDRTKVLRMLASNASSKSLICQMFVSLMDDNPIGVFKFAQLAFNKNVINATLSVLTSMSKKDIGHLRNKMKEAHESGIYHCGCNGGKMNQLRRMSRAASKQTLEDEECEVVEIIVELEKLLNLLHASNKDLTAIYELHLRAKRPDFARHFYMKFKSSIHMEKEEALESLNALETLID